MPVTVDGFVLLEAAGVTLPEQARQIRLPERRHTLGRTFPSDAQHFHQLDLLSASGTGLPWHTVYYLPGLQRVDLTACNIAHCSDLDEAADLVEQDSEQMPCEPAIPQQLWRVVLNHNPLTAGGPAVQALTRCPALRELHLAGCDLRDLPDLSSCAQLQLLHVDDNPLSDSALWPAAASAPRLLALHANGTRVMHGPAEAAGKCLQLSQVQVNGTLIHHEESVMALAAFAPALASVQLVDTPAGASIADWLRAAAAAASQGQSWTEVRQLCAQPRFVAVQTLVRSATHAASQSGDPFLARAGVVSTPRSRAAALARAGGLMAASTAAAVRGLTTRIARDAAGNQRTLQLIVQHPPQVALPTASAPRAAAPTSSAGGAASRPASQARATARGLSHASNAVGAQAVSHGTAVGMLRGAPRVRAAALAHSALLQNAARYVMVRVDKQGVNVRPNRTLHSAASSTGMPAPARGMATRPAASAGHPLHGSVTDAAIAAAHASVSEDLQRKLEGYARLRALHSNVPAGVHSVASPIVPLLSPASPDNTASITGDASLVIRDAVPSKGKLTTSVTLLRRAVQSRSVPRTGAQDANWIAGIPADSRSTVRIGR